jgi:hypothetical protein
MKIKDVGKLQCFPTPFRERERERIIDGKRRGNRKLQVNHGNNTISVKEKIFFILFEIFVQSIIIIL